MLREVIKDDSYFVIYVGSKQYARWVNDCAWHTSDLSGATRLNKEEVNKAVDEIRKAGYTFVEPRAVDSIFNVYDVPRSDKDVAINTFDVSMFGHPYYLYPTMAKKIIDLKTNYTKAIEVDNSDMVDCVKRSMSALISEYSKKGVQFCPACNRIEEGKVVTPVTFGRVLKWTRISNSSEGYVCEHCNHQQLKKIEHWG